jgi:hypothetical protein
MTRDKETFPQLENMAFALQLPFSSHTPGTGLIKNPSKVVNEFFIVSHLKC